MMGLQVPVLAFMIGSLSRSLCDCSFTLDSNVKQEIGGIVEVLLRPGGQRIAPGVERLARAPDPAQEIAIELFLGLGGIGVLQERNRGPVAPELGIDDLQHLLEPRVAPFAETEAVIEKIAQADALFLGRSEQLFVRNKNRNRFRLEV